MNDALCDDDSDDYQNERANAFQPWRTTEDKPQHFARHAPDKPAQHPEHHCFGKKEGNYEPRYPLNYYECDARPQPKGFSEHACVYVSQSALVSQTAGVVAVFFT